MLVSEMNSSNGSSVLASRIPRLTSFLIFASRFFRWLVKPSSLCLYAQRTDLFCFGSALPRM